jgi:hypothetical protein
MVFRLQSVNQMFPSGPLAIPDGLVPFGIANTFKAPSGVTRTISP